MNNPDLHKLQLKIVRVKIHIVMSLLAIAAILAGFIYQDDGQPEVKQTYCATVSPDYPISRNDAGRALFSSNCASCHAIHKDLTGPALENFDDRMSMDFFRLFLRNPQKAYKQDFYIRALAEKFNGGEHIPFKLAKAEIDSLAAYIIESSR
ncbi:c-type cytochrome [Aridibaculum aurantiacum]|uniref:c-type cytochrome n=1 Tax=Aridibaculum aurantiacum TaxID=2810307 RepID=UPI001A97B185|nr:c-type cytochrome [Aridibaculum aurantiacum]